MVYVLTSFTAVMSFQNNKSVKPETLRICVFFFALAHERIFIKSHGIESRCAVGLANVLFVSASVDLSTWNLYWLRQ